MLLLSNAMTFNFMSDGIPIVYYGQEQSFTGAGDPYNREPLWTSNYAQTDAYKLIQSLNQASISLLSKYGQGLRPVVSSATSSY